MPLTAKGEEIKEEMEKEYGSKKGEEVFYGSRNAGTITGVDRTVDHTSDLEAALPRTLPARKS